MRTSGRRSIVDASGSRKVVIAGILTVACLLGLSLGADAVASSGFRIAPPLPVPSGWPADKAARFEAENALRESAASRLLVAPPEAANRTELDAGILALADGGPFNSSQFHGTNLWNGPINGVWEVVQAGGVPTNLVALGTASPAVAGLFVDTESTDPASPASPRVIGIITPSPDPSGKFTIQTISGGILTLALSGSSQLYHFNVATLQFGP